MYLEEAQRQNLKIKMAIQGPSGSGKTFSALLVAYGLCGDWLKIAVIDSENRSSSLYSHLGKFRVLHLAPPFTPERYVNAIQVCELNNVEVIIIDSLSHEWEGIGGILEQHSNMSGNNYTNWAKLTPRHNMMVQHILHSPVHIIVTLRSKQDYILVEKNGKQSPEKVGLKGIQREGMEYDYTLVFELDMKNNASVSKDRTGLFTGKPEEKLSVQTGKLIVDWCNSGVNITTSDVTRRIGECTTLQQLLQVYKTYPQFKEVLQPEYEKHKLFLINNSKPHQLQSP